LPLKSKGFWPPPEKKKFFFFVRKEKNKKTPHVRQIFKNLLKSITHFFK